MEDQNDPQRSEDGDVHEEVRVPDELQEFEDLSKEDFEELRQKALKLIKKDEHVNGAFATLVAARRLYMLAVQSLNRRADEIQMEAKVEAFVTGAARTHAGSEEFTREEVRDGIQMGVLPWLLAEIQEQTGREAGIVAKELAAEDEHRRTLPIPLPFRPHKNWEQWEDEKATMGRDRALTITGHPGAVSYTLDQIVNHAAQQKESPSKPKPTTVRLAAKMINHNVVGIKDKQTFEIGENRWLECGKSKRVITETVQPFYSALLRMRIDMLVVDNLAIAANGGYHDLAEREAWFRAGSVQRNFRKWADESGAALVLGVPFEAADETTPIVDQFQGIDINHSKWTQLLTYTDLIQVLVVEDSPTTYRINAVQYLDPSTIVCVGKEIDRDIIDKWK